MFEVIITYDYQTPATPLDYMVILKGTGYPKTNYKIVAQAKTQIEGLEIGGRIFGEELSRISFLFNDPVLHKLESDKDFDVSMIDNQFSFVEAEYRANRSARLQVYRDAVSKRRAELIALHTPRETGEA